MFGTHRLCRGLLTVGLLMGPVFGAGCVTNPVTGRKELILISEQQELALGASAAPKFEKEFGGGVPNARLQAYVSEIGARVSRVSDRPMPYEFRLVASKIPNAFALPGGKIFLTAGLMSRMGNERQLAAVLGHETGHVAARHNVKGMQRQMGAAVLVEIAARAAGADKGEAAKTAAEVVASVANLKYSRDDEYQADAIGITYMTRAGYNPWGMVELLTVLEKMSAAEPGLFGDMFQTHPLSRKRIDQARQSIESNDAYKTYSPTAPDPNTARFLRMRRLLVATVPQVK